MSKRNLKLLVRVGATLSPELLALWQNLTRLVLPERFDPVAAAKRLVGRPWWQAILVRPSVEEMDRAQLASRYVEAVRGLTSAFGRALGRDDQQVIVVLQSSLADLRERCLSSLLVRTTAVLRACSRGQSLTAATEDRSNIHARLLRLSHETFLQWHLISPEWTLSKLEELSREGRSRTEEN